DVLRVPPALGRGVLEADEWPGAEPVAVLSDALWRRRLRAHPRARGTTIQVDGVAHRVVGVMPAGFHFPSAETELWLPLPIDPAKPVLGDFSLRAVGRVLRGFAPARARRELSALVWRLPDEYADGDMSRAFLANAGL